MRHEDTPRLRKRARQAMGRGGRGLPGWAWGAWAAGAGAHGGGAPTADVAGGGNGTHAVAMKSDSDLGEQQVAILDEWRSWQHACRGTW